MLTCFALQRYFVLEGTLVSAARNEHKVPLTREFRTRANLRKTVPKPDRITFYPAEFCVRLHDVDLVIRREYAEFSFSLLPGFTTWTNTDSIVRQTMRIQR